MSSNRTGRRQHLSRHSCARADVAWAQGPALMVAKACHVGANAAQCSARPPMLSVRTLAAAARSGEERRGGRLRIERPVRAAWPERPLEMNARARVGMMKTQGMKPRSCPGSSMRVPPLCQTRTNQKVQAFPLVEPAREGRAIKRTLSFYLACCPRRLLAGASLKESTTEKVHLRHRASREAVGGGAWGTTALCTDANRSESTLS